MSSCVHFPLQIGRYLAGAAGRVTELQAGFGDSTDRWCFYYYRLSGFADVNGMFCRILTF